MRPLFDDLFDDRRQAVKIAPVYYVPGNHESRVTEYRDLKQGLLELGVTVLENEKTALARAGEKLTLLGMMDPDFGRPGMDLAGEKEGYTLLLSHRPEKTDAYTGSSFDLVLAGHTHGGQLNIPLFGSVINPAIGRKLKFHRITHIFSQLIIQLILIPVIVKAVKKERV